MTIDRLTDEQVQGIIDWPVPLGRMSAPILAREVRASRKLIADLRALVADRPRNVPIAELPSVGEVETAVLRLIEEAEL